MFHGREEKKIQEKKIAQVTLPSASSTKFGCDSSNLQTKEGKARKSNMGSRTV